MGTPPGQDPIEPIDGSPDPGTPENPIEVDPGDMTPYPTSPNDPFGMDDFMKELYETSLENTEYVGFNEALSGYKMGMEAVQSNYDVIMKAKDKALNELEDNAAAEQKAAEQAVHATGSFAPGQLNQTDVQVAMAQENSQEDIMNQFLTDLETTKSQAGDLTSQLSMAFSNKESVTNFMGDTVNSIVDKGLVENEDDLAPLVNNFLSVLYPTMSPEEINDYTEDIINE